MSQTAEGLDSVAVIGMAGRFPGAPDVETFWRNLEQGREGITFFSERELAEAGASPDLLGQDNYVRAKGVLDGADLFDARFFGYSPREAEILDPQHRVFLECAWAALESAGCVPNEYPGRIGVFAGAGMNTYLLNNILANPRFFESVGLHQTLLASDKDFLSTRAAYKLGLRGPALTVQTACSTSLAAVHLACQSLLNGECDIALAGGVTVSSPLQDGYMYESGSIMSPDGHCRPFAAEAAGTVPGNGVGVVVLRRLADARDNRDTVEAVILGTAINNDGSLKAGYTAPSVDGQAEVIGEALALADVGADTIGYVETHGTGTVLGDPVEVAALTRAFREHTKDTGYCAIGSVKSNVGHLDAAAGVTALIKTVLALRHGVIPPSLHATRSNPALNLDSSPFYVATEPRPWPRGDTPRRAGVSSFGIGGTNVHVVLEQAPGDVPSGPDRSDRPVLLPLSAKAPESAVDNAHRLADHLDAHPDAGLGDVAYTLTRRRASFAHRAAVACRDRADAVAALRRLGLGDVVAAPDQSVRVTFLFPGQGAQYVDMARDLYEHEPVFTAALDRCAELVAAHLGTDLRALLFAPPDRAEDAASALARTEFTQPVIFLVEYALAQLWTSWGVRPDAMVGHSIGEYVAACLAGVFSLKDAARLVVARGRLVQAMPAGAMLSVFLSETDAAKWLDDELSLAAMNSTALSVVSGPGVAVRELERRLKGTGIPCRRLHTSHAFHSPSMDGAVEPLVAEFRSVALHPPQIPFCSNVTGTWITADQATSPEYWGNHLRRPVRFADAVEELLGDASAVFVEVGPGHTLANFVREHRAFTGHRVVVGSVRHPNETEDDRVHLLRSLGRLWSAGVPVDWSGVDGGTDHRVLRLPPYAFQRRRYWVEADGSAAQREARDAGKARSVDDWFYTPSWTRLPELDGSVGPADSDPDPVWVVLGDGIGLGRAVAQRLADAGMPVVRVGAGGQVVAGGDRSWSLDPAKREHFAILVKQLAADDPRPIRFVHLFSLDGEPVDALDDEALRRAGRLGFDSLLALAQGIEDAHPGVPVTIDVLCRGLFSVTGEERLQPENATLTGVCTVAPQELADVSCRVLDISGADPRTPDAEVVRAVHAMLDRPVAEGQLALRGRHWWRRDFDAVRPVSGRTRLRDGGVYLVTGGLGGVGLALAEHIAEHAVGPVLALLGRSEFPAEEAWAGWLDEHGELDATSVRIRRLRALREKGATVVVCRADVTDAGQTAARVREVRDRYGTLNGVIHAAGQPSSGMIARIRREDVDRVLGAKTYGTLVLDQVCANDLDFFVLCSSVTGLLGGPGQSDYCAANAFLDTFAEWKRQRGAPVIAVAWGTWNGVGMAAGLASQLGRDPAGEPTGHPLLRLVEVTDRGRTYTARFSTADSWIVADHRLMGHGLVPGTAYLELIRAAMADQAGDREIEMHDVLFMLPVIVPDGQTRTVYPTFDERDGRLQFAVRSRAAGGGAWREHATGWVSFTERAGDTVRDLDEVLARAEVTEVYQTEEEIMRTARADRFTAGSGPLDFTFGPRWKVLSKIAAGPRRMLATLKLDEAFHADLVSYPLHPAILDMAVGIFRLHAEYPYYLPLAYRSVRILHPLTSTVHCSVEIKDSADSASETLSCDVELLDPEGRVLVQILEFTVKRINDLPALVEQIEQAVSEAQAGAEDDATAGVSAASSALRRLTEGMSEADGRAAFGRVLALPALPSQLVVSPNDLAALRELARRLTPALLAEELDQRARLGATHPRPDLETPYVAPVTDQEKAIAAAWREVLGVEDVGVHDDFFALGGHSLAAVQVNTRIQSQFGVELELRSFLNAPTVAHTADLLNGARAQDTGAGDVIGVLTRAEPDDDLDDLSDEEVETRLLALLAEEADSSGGQV